MPYQQKWILDPSEKKLQVKARQIGGTWTESLLRTLVALSIPGFDSWWISRDDERAKEFILYLATWIAILNEIARYLWRQGIKCHGINAGYDTYMTKDNVTVHRVNYHNGSRICALTSNPDAARGNHGNLGIDELAAHKNQSQLYRVARPIVTTGGNLSIISTHAGPGVFKDLVEDAEGENKRGFSLHKTTIVDAVQQGYVQKVVNRVRRRMRKPPLKDADWLQEIYDGCLDEVEWQQEYMCICVEEAYALISLAEIEACSRTWEELCRNEDEYFLGAPHYLGMDIGRWRDLTVFWILARMGDVLYTRALVVLDKADYDTQEMHLNDLMKMYRIRHACIDATNKGEMLAERAQKKWGENTVTPIIVHSKAKCHLAPLLQTAFQRRIIRIPEDADLKADIHRVEKQVGEGGAIRYHAPSTQDGHSDRFFAAALALEAAGEATVVAAGKLRREQASNQADRGNDRRRSHRARAIDKPKPKFGGF